LFLPPKSANSIYGTWSPAVNTAATTTYTFTPVVGQCATTATVTVEVKPLKTPTFTQIPTGCTGTPNNLPSVSSNGIYGSWTPAVNNPAGSITTYTFTPISGQCASTATVTLSVGSSVKPMFDSIPAICAGGSLFLPPKSANSIYGTWSPAVNTAATTTYTFTPVVAQCATTATVTVWVNPLPKVSIDTFAAVCHNAGIVKLTGGSPSGGTYSGISVVNNTFNPIIGAGKYQIKYAYTDANGCSSDASQNLQVVNCKSATIKEFGASQVKFYPNPTTDSFVINVPSEFIGRNYTLLDAVGRRMNSGVFNYTEEKVDVSGLALGTYYFTIDQVSESYKFMKQ
jgi:hypothetical protein